MRAEVRPVGGDERPAEVLQGGFVGVVEPRLSNDDPVGPSTLFPVDGTDAAPLGAHADLRLLVHFDLGDHPTSRGIQAGEVDASGLSDQTAPAVTPDEVLRP